MQVFPEEKLAYSAYLHTTHMFGCVGQQSHKPGLLDSGAQPTLMLGACPRLTARLDLAAIRNELPHKAVGIFVVNFAHMIVAKLTYFAAR